MLKDKGFILAILVALFVVEPLLGPGLPPTADTPIHFYRTLEFTQSLAPEVVYPRWAPDLAYGYGYPLWSFVPPLPYLIPIAIQNLGFSLEISFKSMIILTILLGYGLGSYLFIRQILGGKAALIGATIYTLAPFALREALLYGGNFPQYLAIGLYPWILWSLERLHRQLSWGNVLLSAFFYGAIVLSHLFHALIISPIAACYVVILWAGSERKFYQLWGPGIGLGLGLLWTSCFWIPAFFERSLTRATTETYIQVSPFSLRFLSWFELLAQPLALDNRAANPWMPFSLGWATLGLTGLGFVAVSLYRPPKHVKQQTLFFSLLLVSIIAMVLPISHWAWENIPLLGVAEFPWRLLGVANLCLAFLGSSSLYLVKSWERAGQTLIASGSIIVIILSSAVYLYPFRPLLSYGPTLADMTTYELATQTIGTTTLGEYLPRWVQTVPTTSPLVETIRQGEPVQKLDVQSLPADTTFQQLTHTAIEQTYQLKGNTPFQARFYTFYYPGWTAYLNHQPVPINIEAEDGFITLPIPAGEQTVTLRFEDTPLRQFANGLSGLTILLLLTISIVNVWRNRKGIRQHKAQPTTHATDISPWQTKEVIFVGLGLTGLLCLKAFWIDPYTTLFRMESPPGEVLPAENHVTVNLDDKIWLLGYDLDQKNVPQGETVRLVLYWQAQHPLTADYRSFVHLDAPYNQSTWAISDNFHPGDATAQIDIPTSSWDTIHYIRDEHFLHIPLQTPPLTFDVRVGLYNPETGQRLPVAQSNDTAITLQPLQVTAHSDSNKIPIPNQVNYQLGPNIWLHGFAWDAAGGDLTLFWKTDAPVTEDYTIFVHLLDKDGEQRWGADQPPLGGVYPTSAWEPDHVVVDTHHLEMADLPNEDYTLLIGMYHPETLTRLEVTAKNKTTIAHNAIELLMITPK